MQKYTEAHLFGFNKCSERTAEEPRKTEHHPYEAHYYSKVVVETKLINYLNEYIYQITDNT